MSTRTFISFSTKLLSRLSAPRLYLFPSWVQDFKLLLAELHVVPVGPFLQSDHVALDDSMTSWLLQVHQHGVKREHESEVILLHYKYGKESIHLNQKQNISFLV